MTISLGAGRRLVLAGFEQGWIWALVGLAVLALLIVLYRYERHLVRPRTGLLLLGLRLLAALALVAALFEPVAEHVYKEKLRGKLIVGIDVSDSMTTTDPSRPADRTAALRKQFSLAPAVDVNGLSRREVVRRILTGPWLERIGQTHDVVPFTFARRTAAGSRSTLAEALAKPPAESSLESRTTDWEPLLEHALEARNEGPVVGVLLLTDGRANGPPASRPASARLAEQKIPIDSVLIGSTGLPRDVAVASVQAPETADKGQVARIDVTVKADGLPPGTEVPVTLERPGAEPLREVVRAQPDGGRPVVSFRVPLEQPGEAPLSVAVGPIEQDARPQNDRRSLQIAVTDDRARVLLVDSQPRWEFQYLRNALTRDPRVTLDTVVLQQPKLPDRGDTFYRGELPPKPLPPSDPKASPEPDPLGAYDLIVVGDLLPADLPVEAWDRLDQYVAQRGGTLVFSSGPRGGTALAAGVEVVRNMLPVQDPSPVEIDADAIDPDRPTLPAGAILEPLPVAAAGPWPMLQFAESVPASQTAWAGLPRIPWVLTGHIKPAATALVTAATIMPAPDAASREAVALAAMPYGLGKVLWLGTDSTWRWRFRAGDAFHHRFWGQVVQWAAHGKLTAGNRLVQFGPDPPRNVESQSVRLRARFADNTPGLASGLTVAARILERKDPPRGKDAQADTKPVDTTLAVVPLRPRADEPRVFDAPAPALPPGRYVVRLEVPQLADAMRGEGGDPEASWEVRPRETSEAIELAASRDALERLASATGGTVLAESELDRLPGLLQARTVERTRIEPTRLWDRPEFLLLFLALVTAEWVIRKRAGLP